MKAGNLFGTLACAFSVWATISAAALGQNDPAAGRLLAGNVDDSPLSFTQATADHSPCAGGCDVGCSASCGCPRWTASADFIILDRIGGTSQILVSRVPSSVDVRELPYNLGVPVLTGNDMQQGFAAGPRLGLIRHGDDGYDFELSYFQIGGWSSDRTIAADPQDYRWLTMRAPGGFIQTNQKAGQGMAWDYSSQLYDAEFNVRWNPASRLTMLAGFRWVNLGEKLVGALEPYTVRGECLSGMQRRETTSTVSNSAPIGKCGGAAAFPSTGC